MPELDLEHFKHVRPSNPSGEENSSNTRLPTIIEHEHDPQPSIDEYADTNIVRIPAALRSCDLSKVHNRTDLIRELSRNLPTNEFNLPLFLYRPDLIDVNPVLEGTDFAGVDDMLHSSMVPLTYEQGFPTIGKGEPLWSKLDYETDTAFAAFLQYLEQPGARSISQIISESLNLTSEWYVLNYWAVRAHAYDMYKVAHHARLREHRILKLNDSHYAESEKLWIALNKALGARLLDEDAIKDMSLPEMVSALEKVVKIQRLSVGLSTTGSKTEVEQKTSSVEVIMHEVSQQSGGQRKTEENTDMTDLLSDPDTLSKAQELIIRVNK